MGNCPTTKKKILGYKGLFLNCINKKKIQQQTWRYWIICFGFLSGQKCSQIIREKSPGQPAVIKTKEVWVKFFMVLHY